MKACLMTLLALAFCALAADVRADTPVKFKSTGEGDSTLSTGYSPSDPLQGRPVDKKSEAGHPLTQQSYDENCKEDRCIRAEKRQTSTTTWQQDRGVQGSTAPASAPEPAAPAASSSSTQSDDLAVEPGKK